MLLGLLITEYSLRLVRNKSFRLQLLAREAINENINVVVFAPSGVNWVDGSVNGLVFNVRKRAWKSGKTPFPNAIYDRAVFGSRKREKFLAKKVRKRLKGEYGIPFLNTVNSFDKWKTYQALSLYAGVKKYLPETRLYRDLADLALLLHKYGTVYIKPSGGSHGRGVFQVKQAYDGKYLFSYRERGRNIRNLLTREGFCKKLIAGKLAAKKVIVQQGITLASLKGVPFDIRVRTQKNGAGQWRIVLKFVRMAAPGSIVTNTSNGGYGHTFRGVIPYVFPKSWTRINREINFLVYNACFGLEQQFGQLGEIGFDIALDTAGKIWLLEANTKPGNGRAGYGRYYNPVKYAKYLWKKQNKKLFP